MKRALLAVLFLSSAPALAEPAPAPLGVQLTDPAFASAKHLRNTGIGLLITGGTLTVAAIATAIGYGLSGATCALDELHGQASSCAHDGAAVGYAALGLAVAGVPTLITGGVLTGVGKNRMKRLLAPSLQMKQDRGVPDGVVLQLGGRF